MKTKILIFEWVAIVVTILVICANFVYKIDPYFHYHKPILEGYFYSLDNQRSQNDGISKNFDYDALITGTSMTENFKTSEMDEIFGTHSIKVSYSGGSYKEINDNLVNALQSNPNLKIIVRCLDYIRILDDKESMRNDLGTYPTYLYDNNPFNDVKYLLNRDIIFSRAYKMAKDNDDPNAPRGITSFDDYSRWQYDYSFGIDSVVPDRNMSSTQGAVVHLTEDERITIYGNITQNVTDLADQYPDVEFYYFFSPYSIAYWVQKLNDGTFDKQIEAEEYVIELILEHPNIHLYTFNDKYEIVTDLNNYKDYAHYGQWVNSLILRWIHDGNGLLTKENYQSYIKNEYEFYSTYDYNKANSQEDYEADFHSAAIVNKEVWGAEPEQLTTDKVPYQLNHAEIVDDIFGNQDGIRCIGSLDRESGSDVLVADYVKENPIVGVKFTIQEIGKHRYIEFWGKKESDQGQPAVFVYDAKNNLVASLTKNYSEIDNEWHQYVIELPEIDGEVSIIFNGGYIDNSGSDDSEYIFRNITLY